ncbi:GLRA4 protein, partial [Acromyrmex heyeri]
MHGDFKDPIIPVHFALRIYRNGTVNYLMRRHLILSCQGRLNIFPFDDPLCSFAIESISYEQTAITYVWKNDEGTLRKSPSLTALNAYLIKNQTITCPIKVSWRADGQIVIEEDEFDDFGDSKCSLCQRRFEEQESIMFETSTILRKFDDRSHDHVQPITSTPRTKIIQPIETFENVFEMTDDSLATKVQNRLQTSEGRKALRAGLDPLGKKYVEAILQEARGKETGIDDVYDVYLHKDGLMFGNKSFNVDEANNIIIDSVQ